MKAVFERLKKEFGESVILGFFNPQEMPADAKEKRAGDGYIHLSADAVVKVCAFLREQDDLAFDSLTCLSSVDETGDQPSYALVYHLFSFKHRHRAILKVKLPKDNPKVKSVQGIWSAANWFEREAYDLMGIHFENHPDLRRLLLPLDWTGHPLRKDYEFPLEYNGISCVRPKLK